MDKLKYEIFYWLWAWWHMWLRSWFERIDPEPGMYVCKARPWWHMCCNGDAGGWRTKLCTWLEESWRYSRYQVRLDKEYEEQLYDREG